MPSDSQADLTADCTAAGDAFLGKQVAEAVEAVDEVVPGREALVRQLVLAADADEALLVPGLVAVIHAACGDGLEEGERLQTGTGITGITVTMNQGSGTSLKESWAKLEASWG